MICSVVAMKKVIHRFCSGIFCFVCCSGKAVCRFNSLVVCHFALVKLFDICALKRGSPLYKLLGAWLIPIEAI